MTLNTVMRGRLFATFWHLEMLSGEPSLTALSVEVNTAEGDGTGGTGALLEQGSLQEVSEGRRALSGRCVLRVMPPG